MMKFSERLRQMREKRYSQEDLADMINVSSITISRWENGLQTPRPKRVAELAQILGTTTEYLLGETDNPDQTPQPLVHEQRRVLDMGEIHEKIEEKGVAPLFGIGQKEGMLFLRNGSYEVSVPDTEENRASFWAVVARVLDGVPQLKGIDTSMNIQDSGHSNYHGNVINA